MHEAYLFNNEENLSINEIAHGLLIKGWHERENCRKN